MTKKIKTKSNTFFKKSIVFIYGVKKSSIAWGNGSGTSLNNSISFIFKSSVSLGGVFSELKFRFKRIIPFL